MSIDWLTGGTAMTAATAGEAFRGLMRAGRAVAVPGAHDGMSARLAADAGFDGLYLSGAAVSASMALPDLGMLTLEDMARRAREIVRAGQRPLIVDGDTGYGEALNVMRAVREFEEAGAACIQIEDQDFPKKCGHLNDKTLVSREAMCQKVAAARKAASSLVVCARTDAGAASLDEAIDRANAYAAAGAELIFVEALTDFDAMKRVRDEVAAPLLANMTEFGRTPQTTLAAFDALGYEIVIYPVSAFRVASRAAKSFYATLRQEGTAEGTLDRMMPRSELYDTIDYYDYEKLDAQIVGTVLGEDQ